MTLHEYEVATSRCVFQGRVASVRSDQVRMPDGGTSQRDVLELPGAVGIVAVDEDDRVLLVRQYRHPVRRPLWEIPAGLLDSTLESPVEAAARELAEEGRLRAGKWHTLVDILTSRGMSDETVRVMLARDLLAIPVSDHYVGTDEEAEMERTWVPLDTAIASCLSGELENSITLAGLMAARIALSDGLREVRDAEAPWRARKRPE